MKLEAIHDVGNKEKSCMERSEIGLQNEKIYISIHSLDVTMKFNNMNKNHEKENIPKGDFEKREKRVLHRSLEKIIYITDV